MSLPVSTKNDVTLFSNGIGHFRRSYKVSSKEEIAISIPFKTDSIGDVATSLQVFGKVKLTAPPSFTPANSNATSLEISQKSAMKSLLTQLSGSTVSLKIAGSKEEYQLLGMDVSSVIHDDCEILNDYIVVMKGSCVHRFRLADIEHIEFKDDAVQTEIEKALKSNFQKIKPDSTLLDLTLTPLEDAESFSVQYTIPVAAWKMRYAIREDRGNFTLEGAAIIDNNTDEDWDNFQVSVVTGNPISFSTDIANVVVPQRRFVQLVDQTSLGNVDVEDGLTRSVMKSSRGRGGPVIAASMLESLGPKGSTSEYCSFGLEAAGAADLAYNSEEAAQHGGIDSKEVGDFCIFTSKESITILARKSAVVPMFSVPLSQAGVVLLYKEQNHATRPYRAIKFKNETQYSLGKGKTVIYNEGIFSGECVLESTKPGDKRMLPHCLENSVRVYKEHKGHNTTLSAIRVSDGVGVVEHVVTSTTVYTLSNKKDQSYKFALEHNSVLGSTAQVSFEDYELDEKEKLSTGYRAYLNLPPSESISLTITETRLDKSEIHIGDNYSWVFTNLVVCDKHNLADDEKVQACVNTQFEIDKVNQNLTNMLSRVCELEHERQGVRDDLKAADNIASGDKLMRWVSEIDSVKEEIRELQKVKIPDLRQQLDDLSEKLKVQISNLSVSWSNPQKTPKGVINQ